jgi:hypothetical protein
VEEILKDPSRKQIAEGAREEGETSWSTRNYKYDLQKSEEDEHESFQDEELYGQVQHAVQTMTVQERPVKKAKRGRTTKDTSVRKANK